MGRRISASIDFTMYMQTHTLYTLTHKHTTLYNPPPPPPKHTHIQSVDPDQERQERIQASLKEREREVKMSRTAQEKEWDRERDQLRKSEATQHFKALLVDMVTNQYSSQPVINDHYNP